MKKILWILPLFIVSLSAAQIVSDKTNAIDINANNATLSTVLPEIEWQYPLMEFTHSQENRITVKANVVSKVALKSVTIGIKKVKEEELRGSKPVDISSNAFNIAVEQNLFLADGENLVEIVVENEGGGIVRDYRTVLVGLDAISDAVAIDRKDYALFFACDKYDNWNDLVNPVFDAKSIAKELEEKYKFHTEIVENASNDEVFVKLREYAQRDYKPQDQLFIFFAGHGHYDDVYGEGYIVAKNSLASDPGRTTYISHNRLRQNVNNVPNEHIFMVMDVCFGGTFDPVLASSRALGEETNNREYLARKLSKKTRKYLTSGSKEYVSDGIAGQHSPFAQRFLEALKSNGGDDRILILDELKLYMERMQTTPRFGEFGDDEQGSDFVFVAQ